MILFEDEHAYARFDNNSLVPGHVLVVPRRHVASFFDMTWEEKTCVLALLDRAKAHIETEFRLTAIISASTSAAPAGNRACMSMST
jgi:diadenosine tetraphosphate (Ap4A) HIT family hydrolase